MNYSIVIIKNLKEINLYVTKCSNVKGIKIIGLRSDQDKASSFWHAVELHTKLSGNQTKHDT